MAPNAYFIANDGVVICARGRHAVQLESMKQSMKQSMK